MDGRLLANGPFLGARYEVNPEYVQQLEAAGLEFVGRDTTGKFPRLGT